MAEGDKSNGDQATVEERTAHIQALIERLVANSPIYNILLSEVKLVSVSRGVVATHLPLAAAHVNSRGGLHGAVSAAIVDFTTGLAIASWDLRATTGASVDMHISYLSTAGVGDTLEIESTAERVGGSLAFTTARIAKIGEDGERKMVSLGQHTKYTKLPGQTKN